MRRNLRATPESGRGGWRSSRGVRAKMGASVALAVTHQVVNEKPTAGGKSSIGGGGINNSERQTYPPHRFRERCHRFSDLYQLLDQVPCGNFTIIGQFKRLLALGQVSMMSFRTSTKSPKCTQRKNSSPAQLLRD